MSGREESVLACPECERKLLHCHFVLILHFQDDPECSSGMDCDFTREMHVASVSCRELVPPCRC